MKGEHVDFVLLHCFRGLVTKVTILKGQLLKDAMQLKFLLEVFMPKCRLNCV